MRGTASSTITMHSMSLYFAAVPTTQTMGMRRQQSTRSGQMPADLRKRLRHSDRERRGTTPADPDLSPKTSPASHRSRQVTRSALRAPRPAARLREPDRPSPHRLDELLDSSSSAPRP